MNRIFKNGLVALCAALLLAVSSLPARADVIVDFDGNGDLGLLVVDLGTQVEFFLGNVGLSGSTVGNIFLTDANGNLSNPFVSNFDASTDYAEIPGMSGVFTFAPATAAGGIDSGEYLSIFFDLTGSFQSIVAALGDGSLRMSVNVTDVNGAVQSFTSVPVPAAIWLLSAGLGALPLVGRRGRRG